MMSEHPRTQRSSGARRLLDNLIRSGHTMARGHNFAYWRCIDSIRSYTQMLHHSQLMSVRGRQSLKTLLLAVVELARVEKHWIHAPETYVPTEGANSREQWIGFVSHVLQEYRCPRFLADCWLHPVFKPWWSKLHCHLGAGLSARRFALPDRTYCNKATARWLMQAPNDANPDEAFRWAQVMATAMQLRVEPDPKLARALMKRIPLGDNADVESFWRESLRFFVRNPMPHEELLETITLIERLRHEPGVNLFPYSRMNDPVAPTLSIANRSKRSIRRLVANWKTEYAPAYVAPRPRKQRPLPIESWSGIAVPDMTFYDDDENEVSGSEPVRWEIVQLLTTRELQFEGKVLNHCVGSYAYRCASGRSTIWSLRQWKGERMRRVVTIELLPERFLIVQAKGSSNRLATADEANFIKRWATANLLRIDKNAQI